MHLKKQRGRFQLYQLLWTWQNMGWKKEPSCNHIPNKTQLNCKKCLPQRPHFTSKPIHVHTLFSNFFLAPTTAAVRLWKFTPAQQPVVCRAWTPSQMSTKKKKSEETRRRDAKRQLNKCKQQDKKERMGGPNKDFAFSLEEDSNEAWYFQTHPLPKLIHHA